MNLCYFGSGAFGLPTLASLASRHRIVAVVTQPDRPAGRGGELRPTPIGAWAAENLPGVPVLKPPKVNDPAVVEQIRALGGPDRADAWVVIAFGQKLGRALLDGVFAVNLHASLLPRWRGAAPINAAILGGDTETGNTVITLADRMDAGLIFGQSRRVIGPLTTTAELHDQLAADGPALVEEVLAAQAAGSLHGRPQDESLVTIAGKLSKGDGAIDFHNPADFCRRLIHALNPWPAVSVQFQGKPLKLLRAAVADGTGDAAAVEPGRLIDAERGVVACGRGTALRLLEVQPAGKRPMAWADFARGRRIVPGEPLQTLESGTE